MGTEVGILDILVMRSLLEVDVGDAVLADVVIVRDAERGVGSEAFHQGGRCLQVIAPFEQIERAAAGGDFGSRGVLGGFLQAKRMLRDSAMDGQGSREQPEENRRVHSEDVILS